MSNDIGYGAAAIKAGDVKYQQSLIDLMKQAAAKKPANDTEPPPPAKSADPNVGRKVDIKA